MKSDLRPLFSLRGKKYLVTIDIRSCHPTFWGKYICELAGISQFLVDINDTTAANRLRYYRLSNTGRPEFANTSNNSLNVQISVSTALPQLVIHKYSAGFKLDDYAFYVNNSQIGTDNLGAMIVSPTTMTIGDTSAGVGRAPLNGTISSIRYYKKRLANAKLQALTA